MQAILAITPDQGWIIDGFPTTAAQAQALEMALLGTVPPKPEPTFITKDGEPGNVLRKHSSNGQAQNKKDAKPGLILQCHWYFLNIDNRSRCHCVLRAE